MAETANVICRAEAGAIARFKASCSEKGHAPSEVVRSLIADYVATSDQIQPGGCKRPRAAPLANPKHFAVNVDLALRELFNSAACTAGTTVSEVLRQWIEDESITDALEPIQKPEERRQLRREEVVFRAQTTEKPKSVSLPPRPPSYSPVPKYILTNITPPDSRHPDVKDFEVIGMSKRTGFECRINVNEERELLGQSDLSNWVVVMEIMFGNYEVGIRADTILDALGYSNERGTETYVWLKRSLYRMRRTDMLVTDRDGTILYDGPLLLIYDYTGDKVEGESYPKYTEVVPKKKPDGKTVMVERSLGRLDRFDIEIPIGLVNLLGDKKHRTYVPIDSRRCDLGLSDMALKISSYIAGFGPVLRNEEGFSAKYEFLRERFGKTSMRPNEFAKAVDKALNELVEVSDPLMGGITSWENCTFKDGAKGVRIFRKTDEPELAGEASESSEDIEA